MQIGKVRNCNPILILPKSYHFEVKIFQLFISKRTNNLIDQGLFLSCLIYQIGSVNIVGLFVVAEMKIFYTQADYGTQLWYFCS